MDQCSSDPALDVSGATQSSSGEPSQRPSQAFTAEMFGMQAIMNDAAHDPQDTLDLNASEMKLVSSQLLLSDAELGSRVRYEGKILHYDPRPRGVASRDPSQSPKKRSRSGDSDSSACDVLLVDNTGPVLVTLWGSMVNDWYTAVSEASKPFVSLEAMRVADLPSKSSWHGQSVTKIRVLHSTSTNELRAGTTITMLAKPSSPFLLSERYVAPTWPTCVTQFASVRSKFKPPFRVTLRGVITDLSEMQMTLQETNKRTFILVDEAGSWLRCCALAMTARSRALANNNEVVLYFGTGRAGLGSSPGMVYFFKDSIVLQVGYKTDAPIKRMEIVLDAE